MRLLVFLCLWAYCVCFAYYFVWLDYPKIVRTKARHAVLHPLRTTRKAISRFWRWSATWEWFAVLFVGALALVAIGEFALGLFVITLSGLSLFSKLVRWHGIKNHVIWTTLLKTAGGVGVVILFLAFVVITMEAKAEGPWSHLPTGIIRIGDELNPLPTIPIKGWPSPQVPMFGLKHTSPVLMAKIEEMKRSREGTKPIVTPEPIPVPPMVELSIATGNDDADRVEFLYKTGDSWFEQERKCTKPFRCYPERDFKTTPIVLTVGDKNWVRVFFTVYNVGGSPIKHPVITINLASGHGVSINPINDHHPLGATDHHNLDFQGPSYADILPFSITQTGTDFASDLVVDPTINQFILGIRIYGENLPARLLLATFKVNPILSSN